MQSKTNLIHLLLGIGLTVAAVQDVHAAESRMVQQALTFAKENGLPVKWETVGPANRQVKRLLVPITQDKWDNFREIFTSGNGYAHLCFTTTNSKHLALSLQKEDCYLWARNCNGTKANAHGDLRHWYNVYSTGGYVIPLDLSGARLNHLSGWLAQRENDQLYNAGNCMEWLPNAEVGPNECLFHWMGIARSKDGGNMKAKILHAGNENVQVVGVCVKDLNAFTAAQKPQDLLGPHPSGGIEDAVH
jgi:hypothetical protein